MTTTTTPGLDVSHWQGDIDWPAIARAGYQWVYAKATEADDYVDQKYAQNRIRAKAAGLTFGSYHFARGRSVQAEAAHFAAVVGAVQPGEFLVLDNEVAAATPTWARSWLDTVTGYWGVKPLLYTYESMRTNRDWRPVCSGDYGLILAHYDGRQTQDAAAPWPFMAAKQFTDKGGPLSGDLDVFFGDRATLGRYCAQAAPVQPPTPPTPPVPPSPLPGAFDVRGWRVSAGQQDPHLPSLQAWANRMYPGYGCTPIGPLSVNYGPQTVAFVREFGSHVGVPNDGRDIGPRIAAALYAQGFRG